MAERICTIDRCDRLVGAHGARGMCPKHYRAVRSTLPPLDRRADARCPSDDEMVRIMAATGSLAKAAVAMGVKRESLRTFLAIRPELRERMEAGRRRPMTADEVRAYKRGKAREHRARYPERTRAQRRASMNRYDAEYRHRWNHYNRLRRKAVNVPDALSVEYAAILRRDPCVYCGAPCEEIDHIEALAVGGSGAWDNLAPTCTRCNRSKQTRSVLHFMLARRPVAS